MMHKAFVSVTICLVTILSLQCRGSLCHGDSAVVPDAEFWTFVSDACVNLGEILKSTVTSKDIENLRIIQYYDNDIYIHNLYPYGTESLMNSSHFKSNKRTVIFIHGFVDDPTHFTGISITRAYKTYGDYNILVLDSSKLIGTFYLKSSVAVKFIGTALGRVLSELVDRGVDVNKIHLVGHSLGAHIAGFAGKAFQRLKNGYKLPRITGLDPAGPCYRNVSSTQRLDKEDASFVDVIHTNNILGIEGPVGHVDFYPNGGINQPGCADFVCSHGRAWKSYEESINKHNAFVGVQCASWTGFQSSQCMNNDRTIMGHAAHNATRGTYYLCTNSASPYGLGELGVQPAH